MAKKEEDLKKIFYLKVNSINDLARLACNFESLAKEIFVRKQGNEYLLYTLGEDTKDAMIAYCFATKKIGEIIKFKFNAESTKESVEFVNEIDAQDLKSYYLSLVNLDLDKLGETKKINSKDIVLIKMAKPKDIVKCKLKSSVEKDRLDHIYSFNHKEKQVLAAFDIIDELQDGKKILYYSVLEENTNKVLARYNYKQDKLDFVDEFGEHPYMFLKIIYLKDAFPFFKS